MMNLFEYIMVLPVLIGMFSVLTVCIIVWKEKKKTAEKKRKTQKNIEDSEKYISDNKDKLIDVESVELASCCVLAEKLMCSWMQFDKSIKKYELNKLIYCSSSVVSAANNNKIKYLFKYSKLEYSHECIRDINFCRDYVESIICFRELVKNLILDISNRIPEHMRFYITHKRLVDIIAEKSGIDSFVFNIKIPVFTFCYCSPQKNNMNNCSIPMTCDLLDKVKKTIYEDIDECNYAKRQRRAMTKELRESIKIRDNYTCCSCGNSIYKEPNLLLEIDHIIPISKGGKTEPNNLQTLCWKCNRSKSDKSVSI